MLVPTGGPTAQQSSGRDSRQEVILWSLFAITLPTAFGAGLGTYLFVRRRRLARMCSAKGKSGSMAVQGDDDEQQQQRNGQCCYALCASLDRQKGAQDADSSSCVPAMFAALLCSHRDDQVRNQSCFAYLQGVALEFLMLASCYILCQKKRHVHIAVL